VLSKRTSLWISDFFKLPPITGAGEINFTRLILEGHAKKLDALGEDYPLEGLELKQALQSILYYSHITKIPTKTSGSLWYLIDPTRGSPSNFGFGMVIGYRGEFKVSSRISMSLGNVLEEGLEKLFLKHPVMKRLRRGKIEECGSCVNFRQCRGDRNASYGAYGHFFGPDPGCWLLNKNGNQQMGAL
jgi:MoaA/NifB/PqqE/SkfB family radical SAM enzyme